MTRGMLSTLTTRGRGFLSAGLTSAFCAIVLGQRDLLRVGLLLIGLPVITALIAHRSRYLLTCSREISSTRVEVGQGATVTLTLDNPGRFPTGLMLLEDQVPYVLGTRPRFVLDQLRPRWHRSMQYIVRSEVRGRFDIGPLNVRISDPFGFVELNRSFTSRATLIVTPQVVALPAVRVSGDWSGTGDNRPRAFAAAGAEDVMVREYRLGDDLRRIHWRSTARADELMVRREEQPHQSRATLLLDTRSGAHRGAGPASSFEFAVSAVASIGAHLARQGFTVRMLTDGPPSSTSDWHERGISGPAEVQLLLDSLAVMQTSARQEFAGGGEQHSSGLVIAVLGAVSPTDLAALSRMRAGSTRCLCILLDVAAWARADKVGAGDLATVRNRAVTLQRQGWSVTIAGPSDRLPALWGDFATAAPAARGDLIDAGVTERPLSP
ncbi:MAG: DUF58 domain-containing protein [Nocardioidaceae bacterium]|nr:DUF58 domain-containing protein [Nocardioidaceae bacterium]